MLLEVIATIVNGGGSSSRPLPVIREQLIMDEDRDTIRTLHHTIQIKARQRLMIGRNRSRNSRVNENENENEISGSTRDDVLLPVQVPDAVVVLQQDVKARLSVNGTALRADDDASISSLRHITTTTTNTSNNNNIEDSNNNTAAVIVVVVDCHLTIILEAPPLPTLTIRPLILPRLLQLGPLWGPEEGGTLIRLHGEGLFSQSLLLLQTMVGEAAAAVDSTTTATSSSNNNNNDRGVPHVRFGSVSVPCERINDTTLCCLSPPHPPGIVKVSLVRCNSISHNNHNNSHNNHNNHLTGNNNRILLEEDDEDEQDETTFEYVRLGAAFDTIFATTNSYCPLRSRQKQDPTNNNDNTNNNGVTIDNNNNGVIDNNNNDDDDDDNGFTG
jgi:hypothetical protein